MDISFLLGLVAMILGFGFVVFWHELGHFLAAKWAGVKVDQFAVGFGRAIICWRKGIGFTVGTSARLYEARATEHLRRQGTAGDRDGYTMRQIDEAAASLGLGETEYRWNWIPLGGYVKMLGQEDLNPQAFSPDPRSYNSKTILQRMVIVSAGVVMNIVLAGILFFVLFYPVGFRAPAAIVGAVQPGSPAQAAGVVVGDRLLDLNGNHLHDFTKVTLSTALLPDEAVPLRLRRSDAEQTVQVRARQSIESQGMMAIGIRPASLLQGPAADKVDIAAFEKLTPQERLVRPDERIVTVSGRPVEPTDYAVLDQQLQEGFGRPVEIGVRGVDGTVRTERIEPTFMRRFNTEPFGFAGLAPRVRIIEVRAGSPAEGKVQVDDVVLSIRLRRTKTLVSDLGVSHFLSVIAEAAAADERIDLTVRRVVDGVATTVVLEDIPLNFKIEGGRRGQRGLGVATQHDVGDLTIGDVLDNSPAASAQVPAGSTLIAIAGQPLTTWHDVFRILSRQTPGPVELVLRNPGSADPRTLTLNLGEADVLAVASHRYEHAMRLADHAITRRTANPVEALVWGVEETRDLILKTYLTLRRMIVDRTVSPTNLMGPIEIFRSGSFFAQRGPDWFIWFLAMLSANLAVVNFLPMPIVDGGLFTLLVLEKITGKPPPPRLLGAINTVGLVFILSLFLFVTYNDITRILNL